MPDVPASLRRPLGASLMLPDLRRCEAVIEQGLSTFFAVGDALREVHDHRLYGAAGYTTFASYCAERWRMSRQHAYRLMTSAGVAEDVSPVGDRLPSERVARELAQVPSADERRAVWQEVSERQETVTALAVRQHIEERAAARRAETVPPCAVCGALLDWPCWHCPACGTHVAEGADECGVCYRREREATARIDVRAPSVEDVPRPVPTDPAEWRLEAWLVRLDAQREPSIEELLILLTAAPHYRETVRQALVRHRLWLDRLDAALLSP